MILGLTGLARSGKDTVANMLLSLHGGPTHLVQVSDPLKAYCREVFDWTRDHTDGHLKDTPDERYPRPCRSCASSHRPNCPTCKGIGVVYLTPRHAMQQLGGEFAASTYPQVYSVAAAKKAATDGLGIVTDCRFLRDIQAVKDVGGIIIEVRRRAAVGMLSKASATHPSELECQTTEFQALVDHHIDNDGSLPDLALLVNTLWAQLKAEESGINDG